MIKKWMTALTLVLVFLPSAPAQATASQEFIMSATYGVLTGTLVGAATLAFTDRPGDNLNRVARGASLGLYLGIALGLYVIYIVPGQGDDEPELFNAPGIPGEEVRWNYQVYPLITKNGIEGVQAQWKVLEF